MESSLTEPERTGERPLLRVLDVEKTFGTVRAVDGLSFEVRRGEIFAFLGPNGAGKSTTVRMLVGLLQPDVGRIDFALDGRTVGEPPPSQVGYLPEDRGLYPEVPVLRTLTYMGTLRGMDRGAARRSAEGWLDRLGLADRAEDKLDALSKGNQQKVQLIAAVLHRPAFAILDEPFSGLDPINQERFLDLIRDLRDDGTTVLLSAHQMHLVERLADRLLILDRGRAVLAGRLEDLRRGSGGRRRLRLRLAGDPAPGDLGDLVGVAKVEAGDDGEVSVELGPETSIAAAISAFGERYEILSVRTEEPSLHDLYVQHVGAGVVSERSPEAPPSEAGEVT
ncbi:MAG: ATP-binding cassette domain-containing protein [Acidobacteriota bacterium]